MIGSICVSTKESYLDKLPNEILDMVVYYLGEEDLQNFASAAFGSGRIEASANKALKVLQGKYFNNTILSLKSTLFPGNNYIILKYLIDLDSKKRWLENARRLHYESRNGDRNLQVMREIYQELTRRGFKRELKNWNDSSIITALMRATIGGNLHICRWLVKENLVDVNTKYLEGRNALHIAADFCRTEISSFLLKETSINVNEQTDDGRTALHFAAQTSISVEGRVEVTKILLKYDPQLLMDEAGDTALDHARRNGNEPVVELLTSHYNI